MPFICKIRLFVTYLYMNKYLFSKIMHNYRIREHEGYAMKTHRYVTGYTLVELMVTVGIISVLAGIAIPAYHGYISTSAQGTAEYNAKSLAGFEDTYFYDNGTYLAGSYNPPGANGLAALGWTPSGGKNNFKYVVVAGSTGDIADSYKITVTSKADPSISAVATKP
jgi:prepilin-type N-terminal cleavage/methylation domain-containing protein